jgi:hypothetical protein
VPADARSCPSAPRFPEPFGDCRRVQVPLLALECTPRPPSGGPDHRFRRSGIHVSVVADLGRRRGRRPMRNAPTAAVERASLEDVERGNNRCRPPLMRPRLFADLRWEHPPLAATSGTRLSSIMNVALSVSHVPRGLPRQALRLVQLFDVFKQLGLCFGTRRLATQVIAPLRQEAAHNRAVRKSPSVGGRCANTMTPRSRTSSGRAE